MPAAFAALFMGRGMSRDTCMRHATSRSLRVTYEPVSRARYPAAVGCIRAPHGFAGFRVGRDTLPGDLQLRFDTYPWNKLIPAARPYANDQSEHPSRAMRAAVESRDAW